METELVTGEVAMKEAVFCFPGHKLGFHRRHRREILLADREASGVFAQLNILAGSRFTVVRVITQLESDEKRIFDACMRDSNVLGSSKIPQKVLGGTPMSTYYAGWDELAART